CQQYASYPLTF
nr:immunoglobulin light chain junction region [Macaca mulatta]MOX97297.1 immunoglobulin light chain junction region [Macaca mulatta]MOX97404.1 immunoglobulin light chain junction region [Macaca mulatta]MOX97468.1 immunoglobulin light chain junction region [Macaca mulatta]MOX97648.1 immunoglobulin light chain junction region [Macaca mulatta]